MLTIALLAIVCMLIACFSTSALLLIYKYICVKIWIAKCDLRPLYFAKKCPQNAGDAISKDKFQKFPGAAYLPTT